ncbi:hypothetical protein [Histidinibacterium aquaticum]|uniref:Uncharacterized protein n=1 Tax=Histidinibacterium aquaticum TaxID=2613962 RepID=A0A5J5GL27_9RHOB|nr:hypothetical protein [Histidinibacterium aquaticum]KAA9008915.1 hypothetical protein F3S47_06535 [Histidinibacterium aquaticum]
MRTKFALTTAAAALIGTAAAADSYFTYINEAPQERDNTIELGTVVADTDGFVAIFDVDGDILGTEAVNAGANQSVDVNIGEEPSSDVTAALFLGEAPAMTDGSDDTDMPILDVATAVDTVMVQIDVEGVDDMDDDS